MTRQVRIIMQNFLVNRMSVSAADITERIKSIRIPKHANTKGKLKTGMGYIGRMGLKEHSAIFLTGHEIAQQRYSGDTGYIIPAKRGRCFPVVCN